MFPDPTLRLAAVRLCFNSTASSVTVDPTPAVRRACYFDYKVTNNEQAGRDANIGMVDYQNEKANVGKPYTNTNKFISSFKVNKTNIKILIYLTILEKILIIKNIKYYYKIK